MYSDTYLVFVIKNFTYLQNTKKIILIIFISIFPFITSFFVNVTYTKKNVTQIKTHVTKSKIQVSFIAYCLLND